jgi:hypothetical protein
MQISNSRLLLIFKMILPLVDPVSEALGVTNFYNAKELR